MVKIVHSRQSTAFLSPVLMPGKGYDHSTVRRIAVENYASRERL